MPEYKQFVMDGTPITFDLLANYAANHRKINLIKVLRLVSGMGLADSKNAIEKYCMDGHVNSPYAEGEFNSTKTLKYFAQWLGPFETAEEKAVRLAAERDMKESKAILKGMECIIANWDTLGFMDKYQAASLVIENLKLRSLGVEG